MTTRKWGSEQLVNTTTAGNQDTPAVAALADGGYVVVWQTNSGGAGQIIAGQRFDAVGHSVAGEFIVDASTVFIPGVESHPEVTGLAAGGFAVTFTVTYGPGD